eukprot:TRINITY_DN11365_c0_g1_i1.p1 TRINITY_DN11365_c0_g1~~TRINITY_DN11365_c0_g1_i1.p1  ORF type:complete len:2456 (+),score=702.50 TRINITY_DN11365_c0_g1_i1:130-7497(+)
MASAVSRLVDRAVLAQDPKESSVLLARKYIEDLIFASESTLARNQIKEHINTHLRSSQNHLDRAWCEQLLLRISAENTPISADDSALKAETPSINRLLSASNTALGLPSPHPSVPVLPTPTSPLVSRQLWKPSSPVLNDATVVTSRQPTPLVATPPAASTPNSAGSDEPRPRTPARLPSALSRLSSATALRPSHRDSDAVDSTSDTQRRRSKSTPASYRTPFYTSQDKSTTRTRAGILGISTGDVRVQRLAHANVALSAETDRLRKELQRERNTAEHRQKKMEQLEVKLEGDPTLQHRHELLRERGQILEEANLVLASNVHALQQATSEGETTRTSIQMQNDELTKELAALKEQHEHAKARNRQLLTDLQQESADHKMAVHAAALLKRQLSDAESINKALDVQVAAQDRQVQNLRTVQAEHVATQDSMRQELAHKDGQIAELASRVAQQSNSIHQLTIKAKQQEITLARLRGHMKEVLKHQVHKQRHEHLRKLFIAWRHLMIAQRFVHLHLQQQRQHDVHRSFYRWRTLVHMRSRVQMMRQMLSRRMSNSTLKRAWLVWRLAIQRAAIHKSAQLEHENVMTQDNAHKVMVEMAEAQTTMQAMVEENGRLQDQIRSLRQQRGRLDEQLLAVQKRYAEQQSAAAEAEWRAEELQSAMLALRSVNQDLESELSQVKLRTLAREDALQQQLAERNAHCAALDRELTESLGEQARSMTQWQTLLNQQQSDHDILVEQLQRKLSEQHTLHQQEVEQLRQPRTPLQMDSPAQDVDLTARYKSLQRQYLSATKTNETLQTKCDQLKQQAKYFEEQHQSAISTLHERDRFLLAMQDQLLARNTECEQLRHTCVHLQTLLVENGSDDQHAGGAVGYLQQSLHDAVAQNNAQHDIIEKLQAEISALSKQKDEAVSMADVLQRQIDELRQSASAVLSPRSPTSVIAAGELGSDVSTLRKTIGMLTSACNERDTHIAQLSEHLTSLQSEVTTDMDDMQLHLTRLQAELETMSRERDSLRSTQKDNASRIEQLQASDAMLRVQRDALQDKASAAEAKVSEFARQQQSSQMQRENHELKRLTGLLEKQVEELHTDLESAHQHSQELAQRVTELQSMNDQLAKSFVLAEEHVQTLSRSNSANTSRPASDAGMLPVRHVTDNTQTQTDDEVPAAVSETTRSSDEQVTDLLQQLQIAHSKLRDVTQERDSLQQELKKQQDAALADKDAVTALRTQLQSLRADCDTLAADRSALFLQKTSIAERLRELEHEWPAMVIASEQLPVVQRELQDREHDLKQLSEAHAALQKQALDTSGDSAAGTLHEFQKEKSQWDVDRQELRQQVHMLEGQLEASILEMAELQHEMKLQSKKLALTRDELNDAMEKNQELTSQILAQSDHIARLSAQTAHESPEFTRTLQVNHSDESDGKVLQDWLAAQQLATENLKHSHEYAISSVREQLRQALQECDELRQQGDMQQQLAKQLEKEVANLRHMSLQREQTSAPVGQPQRQQRETASEMDRLNTECTTLRQQILQLQQERLAAELAFEQATARDKSAAADKLKHAELLVQQLQRQVAELQQELNSRSVVPPQQVQLWQAELAEHTALHLQAQRTIADTQSRVRELEQQLQNSMAETASTAAQLTASQSEVAEQKQLAGLLEQQLREAVTEQHRQQLDHERQSHNLEQTLKNVVSKCTAQQEELDALAQQLPRLPTSAVEGSRLAQLQHDNQSLRKQLALQQESITELNRALDEKISSEQKEQERLAHLNSHVLREQLDEQDILVTRLSEQVSALRQDNARLQKELSETAIAGDDHMALTEQLKEQSRTIDALTKQVRSLHDEQCALHDELTDERDQNKTLSQQLKQSQTQVTILERKIGEYLEQRSASKPADQEKIRHLQTQLSELSEKCSQLSQQLLAEQKRVHESRATDDTISQLNQSLAVANHREQALQQTIQSLQLKVKDLVQAQKASGYQRPPDVAATQHELVTLRRERSALQQRLTELGSELANQRDLIARQSQELKQYAQRDEPSLSLSLSPQPQPQLHVVRRRSQSPQPLSQQRRTSSVLTTPDRISALEPFLQRRGSIRSANSSDSNLSQLSRRPSFAAGKLPTRAHPQAANRFTDTGQNIEKLNVKSTTLRGHNDAVLRSCFDTRSGTRFVTASKDHTVRVWSIHGANIQTFNAHRGPVRLLQPLELADRVTGSVVASGSDDGTMRLWDIHALQAVRTFSGHHAGAVVSMAASDRFIAGGNADASICVFDLASGQLFKKLSGHQRAVTALSAMSKEAGHSMLLISGSADHTVKLWDVRAEGTAAGCIQTLGAHSGAITSMLQLPGDLLVTADDACTVCVWDTREFKAPLYTISHLRGRVNDLASHSTSVSVACQNGVHVFDAVSGQMQHEIEPHDWAVSSVAIDAKRVVLGSSDGRVLLHDGVTGASLGALCGHKLGVNSIAMSGSQLMSTSDDMTARLWHIGDQ